MTYKVADKLGVERKSWKTAFLTSIYNETATVHGRIDRSEKSHTRCESRAAVHGRIDRSEKKKVNSNEPEPHKVREQSSKAC